MKRTIFFFLMVGLSFAGFGQPVTTTIPDKSYGSGGTKTVTTTTNQHGEVTTITEIKDSEGKVRDRNHTWKDSNGNITVNDTNFTKRGDVFRTVHQEFDNKQILVNSQSKEWVGGNVIHTINRTKKEDGTYDVHIEDKEKGKTYDRNEPAGATYIQPPNDFKHPELKTGCAPSFGIYGGYSYLTSKIGDKMEGYPLGAELTLSYNLNEKWSVQLDGSWHTKSKDDFKYNQSYVLAGLERKIIDKPECSEDEAWALFARILVGGSFFNETFEAMGYSDKFKDCGPAFGIGGRVDLRISDDFRLGAGADYIGTKFDDFSSAYRVSIGARFRF